MKYIRRLLWFLANRLLILLLMLAVITVVFYLSFNTTNIYILVKDGLYQRANVILRMPDDTNEVNALRNFFRQEFLDGDEALRPPRARERIGSDGQRHRRTRRGREKK